MGCSQTESFNSRLANYGEEYQLMDSVEFIESSNQKFTPLYLTLELMRKTDDRKEKMAILSYYLNHAYLDEWARVEQAIYLLEQFDLHLLAKKSDFQFELDEESENFIRRKFLSRSKVNLIHFYRFN